MRLRQDLPPKTGVYVGMPVYLTKYGNEYKRTPDETIINGVISKVGRKYVTVKCGYWEEQFDMTDNYAQKPGPFGRDYVIHFSRMAVSDYFHCMKLRADILKRINAVDYLSKHQLQQISYLLDKGEEMQRKEKRAFG